LPPTYTATLEGKHADTAPYRAADIQADNPVLDSPPSTAGTKRKASLDFSLTEPDAIAKVPRTELVSYGTSVFFKRPVVKRRENSEENEGSTLLEPRSMVIELTDQEAEICKVLDEVARNYEAKEGKKVQLRIAGGWVRDKVSFYPIES